MIFLYKLLFLIFFCFPVHAVEKENYGKFYEPMRFILAGNGGNCNGCEWISAIGTIDEFTPAKFEHFYKQHNSKSRYVVFHSPGGNLIAGMELGRLLRKYKVPVSIGETRENEYGYSDEIKGICASACAYAFLGGISRSIDGKSKIGFHQFYGDSANTEFTETINIGDSLLSTDQVLSGLIAGYLAEMGIDARILTFASLAGNNKLFAPNDNVLKIFRVVTNDGFSPMQMEPFRNGIRVFSINDFIGYPVRKLSAFCVQQNKQAIFMIETDKVGLDKLKESIHNIEFSSDDGNAKLLVPKNNIVIIAGETTDGIIILLPENIRARALNSKSFNFLIDSPRSLFGTWIAGGFTSSDDERQMLRLAWSNCI